ncbi:methyltransferase domain-containing protein [Colletotrichum musicola]|uniref:Methyltransferase domain-containing protein n=1 Tax=Colletotrichum musicola TaxID=2175873 RepID=A0A8H6N984_9PEZI|nr:methyltransferase domain-containing protein [Colletotrichum musicola]
MDFGAMRHVNTAAAGVDLSPIQPDEVPPNCYFEVDDVERTWTWTRPFDFIFIRHGNSCFSSWEDLLRKAYDHLEPGGYIELQDNAFPIAAVDDSLDGTAVARWSSLLLQGTEAIGRSARAPASFARMLRDAGFEDVVERREYWPLTPWVRDRRLHDRAGWVNAACLDGLEASCLAIFTRVLGWAREDVLAFCDEVRRDLKDTRIHAYFDV